jgi:hypothetical protein
MNTRRCVPLALLIIAPVAVGQGDGACTRTAKAALTACQHGAQDDYWITVANCNNLIRASARSACADKTIATRTEAREECQDQFDARLEVCHLIGEAPYAPGLNPAQFVDPDEIGKSISPNPYFPLIPGRRTVLRSGDERVEITVTGETTEILGIKCAVVRDIETENGELLEDTLDWFAQDIHGNVWYFGEISQEFTEGELVSLVGSWKAGVNDAKPGIIMKAAPAVGDVYRQEFALGDAEDLGKVLSLTGSASVPAASCRSNCLVTRDFSPLEPEAPRENKYYAPGVGLILEHKLDSGERLRLVEIHP